MALREQMETIIACDTCGLVQRTEALEPGTVAECCRCGFVVRAKQASSLGRTAALTLAALIFYVPANVYPVLRMNYYGAYSESTVWDGCVSLFRDNQWLVASIVFLASILIPLCKLLGLFYLNAVCDSGLYQGRDVVYGHGTPRFESGQFLGLIIDVTSTQRLLDPGQTFLEHLVFRCQGHAFFGKGQRDFQIAVLHCHGQ